MLAWERNRIAMDPARIDMTPGIGSAPLRPSEVARPRDRGGEFGRGQGVPSLRS